MGRALPRTQQQAPPRWPSPSSEASRQRVQNPPASARAKRLGPVNRGPQQALPKLPRPWRSRFRTKISASVPTLFPSNGYETGCQEIRTTIGWKHTGNCEKRLGKAPNEGRPLLRNSARFWQGFLHLFQEPIDRERL